jgi:hypothetical protein
VLKVHETTTADGSLAPTFLFVEDGTMGITSDEGTFTLPDGALEAVMKRFGKPLDPSERVVRVDELDLGGGCVLRHVRHLAMYDVIARDWLVYHATGKEPLCALATTVAGALAHLARAARADSTRVTRST